VDIQRDPRPYIIYRVTEFFESNDPYCPPVDVEVIHWDGTSESSLTAAESEIVYVQDFNNF
jgi:hypothetical protein